jgi:hypothetical protein
VAGKATLPVVLIVPVTATLPANVPPVEAATVSATVNDLNATTAKWSLSAAPLARTIDVPLVAV